MKKNNKGFTILELLVVVAIIAILAVIAVPQFMGAIEKSRVSAQIADINAVNKAATMYNFDNSKFPDAASALTPTDGSTVYINAFPAASKWNGTFAYTKITSVAAATEDLKTGALAAATVTATDLASGNVVLVVGSVPEEQVKSLDTSVDQTANADAAAMTANAKAGLIRFVETSTDGVYNVFYVIAR